MCDSVAGLVSTIGQLLFEGCGVSVSLKSSSPKTVKSQPHGRDYGAVWFLSIWPNTQEYRYTRRRSTFGFRPGEYSNTGIEILSI